MNIDFDKLEQLYDDFWNHFGEEIEAFAAAHGFIVRRHGLGRFPRVQLKKSVGAIHYGMEFSSKREHKGQYVVELNADTPFELEGGAAFERDTGGYRRNIARFTAKTYAELRAGISEDLTAFWNELSTWDAQSIEEHGKPIGGKLIYEKIGWGDKEVLAVTSVEFSTRFVLPLLVLDRPVIRVCDVTRNGYFCTLGSDPRVGLIRMRVDRLNIKRIRPQHPEYFKNEHVDLNWTESNLAKLCRADLDLQGFDNIKIEPGPISPSIVLKASRPVELPTRKKQPGVSYYVTSAAKVDKFVKYYLPHDGFIFLYQIASYSGFPDFSLDDLAEFACSLEVLA